MSGLRAFALIVLTAAVASCVSSAGSQAVTPRPLGPAVTAAVRVLFDDTKAEEAGNADWIISTSKPDPTAQDASPSSEADWTGALSAWGVALQKAGGYSLQTLAAGNAISYGGSGALDLSNFDVFVLPEPNVLFTAAEKTAIVSFVRNGGGLFMISDHDGSDRNNDGADSVDALNGLMGTSDPFGSPSTSVTSPATTRRCWARRTACWTARSER